LLALVLRDVTVVQGHDPDEDVTKGKDYTHPATSYIHAYGYDKAKQYLAVILGFYTPEK
jgi:hypothetical protein